MSLEMNKIAASVLTAGVVAMGASFIGELLVHPKMPKNPHYSVGEPDKKTAKAEEADKGPEPILPLLADADPSAGKNAARACTACHAFKKGGANKVGPALYGVMGQEIASVDGFSYSSALSGKKGEWTYEKMNQWLYDPAGWAPGTKMSYGGLDDPQARANVIAYMREQADEPLPLPTEDEIQAVTGGDDGGEADGEKKAGETGGGDSGDSENGGATDEESMDGGDGENNGEMNGGGERRQRQEQERRRQGEKSMNGGGEMNGGGTDGGDA